MATRSYDKRFGDLIGYFRSHVDDPGQPSVQKKVRELCDTFDSYREKWESDSEKSEWMARKLDELRGSFESCQLVGRGESMCHPFFDKAERIISEFRSA